MKHKILFSPLDKKQNKIVLCEKSGYTYFPFDLDFIPRLNETIDFDFVDCFATIEDIIVKDHHDLHYDFDSFTKNLKKHYPVRGSKASKAFGLNGVFAVKNIEYFITGEKPVINIEFKSKPQ